MPEKINNRKVFSLREVANSIQKTISDRYKSRYWIKAEMAKLNHYPQSGHCYPDLVEKKDDKIIAQIRATIWDSDFDGINKRFREATKEPLKGGITVLIYAGIKFHPVHGLSLHIYDIDPQYTLGELLKEKMETIEKLKKENIFENNKKLRFPLLPQRIAVISVETSKGYSDFKNKIDNNSWKYKFFYLLFPSLLQGDRAIDTLLNQLRRIKIVKSHFDVVAIIRGGGGDVGMSCYDNYRLAREIALYPLPVLTGIGHSTNETVTEMVAYKNNITPTDLADYLIQKYHNISVPVKDNENKLIELIKLFFEQRKTSLNENIRIFRNSTIQLKDRYKYLLHQKTQQIGQFTSGILNTFRSRITAKSERIRYNSLQFLSEREAETENRSKSLNVSIVQFIKQTNQLLQNITEKISLLDPINVLRRGFSFTMHNGKTITDVKKIKMTDEIITILFRGQIVSNVKSTKK